MRFASAFIVGALFCHSATGRNDDGSLPGTPRGEAEARWLAPYTLAMTSIVNGQWVITVRWFDDKGQVVRELSDSIFNADSSSIRERRDGTTVYHSLDGRWSLTAPKTSTRFTAFAGDTLVQQNYGPDGGILVDTYVAGKLVGSAGPFIGDEYEVVHLAEDGSMALLAWKTAKKRNLEVVVIGRDGKRLFNADCDQDVTSPISVGGGKGVLVQVTGGPPVRFRYLEAGGHWVTFDVGPNAFPIVRASFGSKVLFGTSVETERFKLIDCTNGKVLWDIPSPVEHVVGFGSSSPIVVGDDLVFLGPDLAAVGFKSGEVIARWQPRAPRTERGSLIKRGTRLFMVTKEAFAEIDPADIKEKRNGWR